MDLIGVINLKGSIASTVTNQNCEMYTGNTKSLVVDVAIADNTAVASIKWAMRQQLTEWGANQYADSNAVFKEMPDVTLGTNQITIPLLPVDTINLTSGNYYHECEITDLDGNVTTIFTGIVTLGQSIVTDGATPIIVDGGTW